MSKEEKKGAKRRRVELPEEDPASCSPCESPHSERCPTRISRLGEMVWPSFSDNKKTEEEMKKDYDNYGFVVHEVTYEATISASIRKPGLGKLELVEVELHETLSELPFTTELNRMVVSFPVKKAEAKSTEQALVVVESLDIKHSIVGKGDAILIFGNEYTSKLCTMMHHLKDGTFIARGINGLENARKVGVWLASIFDFDFTGSD